MAEPWKLPIYAISRLRMGVDGEGIRTLVAVHGCPLRCRYCLNDKSHEPEGLKQSLTQEELYAVVAKDELYYRATNGGVTFGGGEPALYADFIAEFASTYCERWSVNLETSLSVPKENVEKLIPFTDRFYVDIKTMDPEIYRAYTGGDLFLAQENLRMLSERCPEKVLVRIPLIPEYNDEEDRQRTVHTVSKMGLAYDLFAYTVMGGTK